MRDRWYGDYHDLVKWSILLKLSEGYHASKIVQVAYYRPETIKIDSIVEKEAKELGADPGRSCIDPMPNAVLKHFSRSLMEITRLSSEGVQIQVVNSVWSAEGRGSGAYMQKVKAELEKLPIDSPCIIFLDPDTGLEPPNGKPELEHVLESELQQIWEKAARVNDVLVFYQHKAPRINGESWIKLKNEQFESALHLCNGAAKLACSGDARLAGGKAATASYFSLLRNLTRIATSSRMLHRQETKLKRSRKCAPNVTICSKATVLKELTVIGAPNTKTTSCRSRRHGR